MRKWKVDGSTYRVGRSPGGRLVVEQEGRASADWFRYSDRVGVELLAAEIERLDRVIAGGWPSHTGGWPGHTSATCAPSASRPDAATNAELNELADATDRHRIDLIAARLDRLEGGSRLDELEADLERRGDAHKMILENFGQRLTDIEARRLRNLEANRVIDERFEALEAQIPLSLGVRLRDLETDWAKTTLKLEALESWATSIGYDQP